MSPEPSSRRELGSVGIGKISLDFDPMISYIDDSQVIN
tara:strand:- start:284 stop:397 length:114 start_codon:yes stop_codon:yes gene_type:complete